MRIFTKQSILTDGSLALALAPALTPTGIDSAPNFFRGFAVYPQILARGLLVLADVTSTRYFKYTPVSQRDPVLSAQGDRVRAECFSACNSVYARLDLLQAGFDGQISFGTTNVDIGMELRTALVNIKQEDKLHVAIGSDGLMASPIKNTNEQIIKVKAPIHERPVQMPDRWVRALGNAAGIHQEMKPAFTIKGVYAKTFVASLPAATGKNQAGWLTPSPTGVKLMPRRTATAVYVSGLHRLSALKRIMTNLTGMTFYMPKDELPGAFMVEAELPGARITFSLTAEAWQGYSGEGALLESLAKQELLEDMEAINSTLSFNAEIDEALLANNWSISKSRTQEALTLLAISGKLGFDVHEQAYFHRELPDDPDRVLKDNPRLKAARKLVEQGGGDVVKHSGENNQWMVHSGEAAYRVTIDDKEAKCTCTWYLNHQNRRGPCKHILAVKLKEGIE